MVEQRDAVAADLLPGGGKLELGQPGVGDRVPGDLIAGRGEIARRRRPVRPDRA
jgi:hypothetical protein